MNINVTELISYKEGFPQHKDMLSDSVFSLLKSGLDIKSFKVRTNY